MSQSRNARTWIVRAIFFLVCQFVLAAILLLPRHTPPVSAASRYVNHFSGVDSGNCLAVNSACYTIGYAMNQASNNDTITIIGHFVQDVFTENLTFNKSLRIIGPYPDPNLCVIDGNGGVTNQRVITVTAGVTVSLSNLTIRNGRINGAGGAGISNEGTLIIDTVVITGNQITGSTSNDTGGGIDNSGILTVTNSTISNNTASRGGGIFNAGLGTLVLSNTLILSNQASSVGGMINYGQAQLTNVTVDGNNATNQTGGIDNQTGKVMSISNSTISNNFAPVDGGITNAGTLTLANVTVSGNHATTASVGGLRNTGATNLNNVTFNLNTAMTYGGGLYNSGAITVANTIIANSTSANCSFFSSQTQLTSKGFNLSSDATCLLSQLNDLNNNAHSHLSALGNYGGATKTHGLLYGSAAINTGDTGPCTSLNFHCMPTDQRGVTRPQAGRSDIGAFEGWLYPLYLPLILR